MNISLHEYIQRRILELGATTSLFVVIIYAYQFFINGNVISSLNLTLTLNAAIMSAISFTLITLAYILFRIKGSSSFALTGYTVLLLFALMLIAMQFGVQSRFLAIWFIFSTVSFAFSWIGYGISFILASSYIAWIYIGNGTPEISHMYDSIIIASPVVIGLLFCATLGRSIYDKTKRQHTTENTGISYSNGLIQAINDGVAIINKKGHVIYLNPSAQKLLGWSQKDAKNLHYKSVVKLFDNTNHEVEDNQSPISRCLGNNQPENNSNLQLETTSGRKFLAHISVSPTGTTGNISGVIVIFRDITKEHAEEREQAEFISTASHEMRTPVASIEGYLGLALNPQTATIDAKARSYITKAHQSAKHLGELFQDLLDVARADDGRLAQKPKVVNIVELGHEIATTLLGKARAKNIRLNYKPQPDLYTEKDDRHNVRVITPTFYVNVDPAHLREVITNLIENAIKYTPKGMVTIDITGDKQTVKLSVQDTGIGIPKEDIPHLFQKFYRVDNSDTREIGGTGLGLYLSHKLVEAMDGRLWVESVYKQGSTFFVELPRMSSVDAQRAIDTAVEDSVDQSQEQTFPTERIEDIKSQQTNPHAEHTTRQDLTPQQQTLQTPQQPQQQAFQTPQAPQSSQNKPIAQSTVNTAILKPQKPISPTTNPTQTIYASPKTPIQNTSQKNTAPPANPIRPAQIQSTQPQQSRTPQPTPAPQQLQTPPQPIQNKPLVSRQQARRSVPVRPQIELNRSSPNIIHQTSNSPTIKKVKQP